MLILNRTRAREAVGDCRASEYATEEVITQRQTTTEYLPAGVFRSRRREERRKKVVNIPGRMATKDMSVKPGEKLAML